MKEKKKKHEQYLRQCSRRLQDRVISTVESENIVEKMTGKSKRKLFLKIFDLPKSDLNVYAKTEEHLDSTMCHSRQKNIHQS